MRKAFIAVVLLLLFVQAYEYRKHEANLPASNVYQLRATPAGELGVYCLNGADATIRPSDEFGHITVSCGK